MKRRFAGGCADAIKRTDRYGADGIGLYKEKRVVHLGGKLSNKRAQETRYLIATDHLGAIEK